MSLAIESTTLVTSIIAGAVFSGLFAKLVKQLIKIQSVKEKSDILKSKTEFGINIAGLQLRHQISGENVSEPLTEQLISQVEDDLLERLSDLDGISKTQVREEIENKVADIRGRIEQIETRFPDTVKIDKISSINDALFAERIELLAKRLDSLESKILSKWDVAIIVSLVIAGISFIVGATYSVITVWGN